MNYLTEYDNKGNVIRKWNVDEFGNEEVEYNVLEEDSGFKLSETVGWIVSRFKLEISINKELYNNGSITKELYEKIQNILLERMTPFSKYIEA